MSFTGDQLEGFEDLLEVAGRIFLHGSDQFRGIHTCAADHAHAMKNHGLCLPLARF